MSNVALSVLIRVFVVSHDKYTFMTFLEQQDIFKNLISSLLWSIPALTALCSFMILSTLNRKNLLLILFKRLCTHQNWKSYYMLDIIWPNFRDARLGFWHLLNKIFFLRDCFRYGSCAKAKDFDMYALNASFEDPLTHAQGYVQLIQLSYLHILLLYLQTVSSLLKFLISGWSKSNQHFIHSPRYLNQTLTSLFHYVYDDGTISDSITHHYVSLLGVWWVQNSWVSYSGKWYRTGKERGLNPENSIIRYGYFGCLFTI